MAGPAFEFKLAGLPGQVSTNGLSEGGAIVWVDRGHSGLMVEREIGAFVAELLPEVHVIRRAVPGVAVGQIGVPDANVGAADRQIDTVVGQVKFFLELLTRGDVGA